MAEAEYHACAVWFPCIHFYPLKFSVFWNMIHCSLATVYQNGEPHVSNVHKLLCQYCTTRTHIVINMPLLHLVVPPRTILMSMKK